MSTFCVCEVGYYNAAAGHDEIDCKRLPPGTDQLFEGNNVLTILTIRTYHTYLPPGTDQLFEGNNVD